MSMTEPGDNGAGARPAPGFTFADKRKIRPNPESAPPAAGGQAAGESGGSEAAAAQPVTEPVAAAAQPVTEPAVAAPPEPDPFERLAAERLADLQRLQAEYANYRKRVDRDRDVARALGIGSVVEALLPVLDDIHLARQHGDLETGPFVSIAEKLEATLARYGVERFGEPGVAFDPAVHHALMHSDEELAEGTEVTTVVGVLQPGYRIGERILRPARVAVADPK